MFHRGWQLYRTHATVLKVQLFVDIHVNNQQVVRWDILIINNYYYLSNNKHLIYKGHEFDQTRKTF